MPKDDIDLPYSITFSARRVGGMSMLIAFADRRPDVSMILLFLDIHLDAGDLFEWVECKDGPTADVCLYAMEATRAGIRTFNIIGFGKTGLACSSAW